MRGAPVAGEAGRRAVRRLASAAAISAIPARRIHPVARAVARDAARRRRADDHHRAHVDLLRGQRGERRRRERRAGAADVAAEHDDRLRRAMPAHDVERAIELHGPRARHRVVECEREIGGRRVIDAFFDDRPRLQVVRQRDQAEIVAERRAGFGRRRERGRHAGHDVELDGRPARVVGAVERLEHGGRHREHAGVARGHDRDAPAPRGELERVARALQLLAVVGYVQLLIGAQRARHVHVGRVADDVGRVGERRARGGGHQVRAAGAEAEHRQAAARDAERIGVDGRAGDGDRDVARLGRRRSRRARRGARGVDARRERRGQRGVEHAGGVARVRFDEAQRRAQRARRVGQRVLGDAPRGRDDGRERERREIMRGERGGDARGKRRQIRRRGARGRRRVRAGAAGGIGRRDAARVVAQALAVVIPIAIAQRDDDAARMDQQRVRVATRRMRRDADHARRVRVARQRDIVEPARIAFDARAFAREQIGHEALARVEIGERVAFGRVQHARAEAQFAARRDRGRDAERVGDLARERVGAREAAQQRHDRAAVLGDGEHGRLRALVGEARRDAANRDAGREQRDDRRAARIQLAQMRAELGEREVRLGAPGERVHPRAVEARLDPARGLERARPEYHDRGRGGHPCHFSPGTTSSEKYGDAIGSTSASGTIRCAAIVARSTYSARRARPSASSTRRTLSKLRPSFITTAASALARRWRSSSSGSTPESTARLWFR
ncbi:hypothetical protein Y046_3854 [Burkholderia pseudomallei MSHR2990]|nr:hypothetical protein Y046_3854 [Burkholderia pseudomallei MSHR2990]